MNGWALNQRESHLRSLKHPAGEPYLVIKSLIIFNFQSLIQPLPSLIPPPGTEIIPLH